MSAFTNVSTYLITIFFGLYIGLLVIRLLLGFSRADFYNPISQLIVKATNPVLLPLRKVIPAIDRIDTPLILVIIFFKFIEQFLLASLGGLQASPLALGILSIFLTIDFILLVYIIAIIAQIILSWVAPTGGATQNPAIQLMYQVTNPILRPLAKIIPKFGMLDLTPLAAIILLNILRILLMEIVRAI